MSDSNFSERFEDSDEGLVTVDFQDGQWTIKAYGPNGVDSLTDRSASGPSRDAIAGVLNNAGIGDLISKVASYVQNAHQKVIHPNPAS